MASLLARSFHHLTLIFSNICSTIRFSPTHYSSPKKKRLGNFICGQGELTCEDGLPHPGELCTCEDGSFTCVTNTCPGGSSTSPIDEVIPSPSDEGRKCTYPEGECDFPRTTCSSENKCAKALWPEAEGMKCDPDAIALIESERPTASASCIPNNSGVTMDYQFSRVRIFYDEETGLVTGTPQIG